MSRPRLVEQGHEVEERRPRGDVQGLRVGQLRSPRQAALDRSRALRDGTATSADRRRTHMARPAPLCKEGGLAPQRSQLRARGQLRRSSGAAPPATEPPSVRARRHARGHLPPLASDSMPGAQAAPVGGSSQGHPVGREQRRAPMRPKSPRIARGGRGQECGQGLLPQAAGRSSPGRLAPPWRGGQLVRPRRRGRRGVRVHRAAGCLPRTAAGNATQPLGLPVPRGLIGLERLCQRRVQQLEALHALRDERELLVQRSEQGAGAAQNLREAHGAAQEARRGLGPALAGLRDQGAALQELPAAGLQRLRPAPGARGRALQSLRQLAQHLAPPHDRRPGRVPCGVDRPEPLLPALRQAARRHGLRESRHRAIHGCNTPSSWP
mmetsp:Transcript_106216/g.317323  ORF Transcript_106216/g.317323 Transcript_106216/m.317323 type:complete len:380 (-) Transcript_106216:22-1161(-)